MFRGFISVLLIKGLYTKIHNASRDLHNITQIFYAKEGLSGADKWVWAGCDTDIFCQMAGTECGRSADLSGRERTGLCFFIEV